MSSSNHHTETLKDGGNIEPFRMESFETSGEEDTRDRREDGFQLYCNLEPEQEISFDELVSSNAEQANQIVAQSKEIVSRAEKKADEIERDAYEKGFAQGQKDGCDLGVKKLDRVLGNIEKVMGELTAYKRKFVEENEKEILALVRRISERVVKGTVNIDSQVVRRTILEAFGLISDPTEVTVKLNEDDLEYVKDLRPEFFKRLEGLKTLTMEADPTVTRGGCLIETGSGNIDARLERQLEMISSAIEQADQSDKTIAGDTEA